MPIVPNALVAKLVSRGYCEGQEILNVTHWRVAGGGEWTPLRMNLLGGAYVEWWNTNVQALTMSTYVMSELVITEQVEGGLQEIYTDGLPMSGSNTGDPLPLNVAACITLATGRAGRSGRGRYYLGCLPESITSGSRFTAPFVAAVNAAFSNMTPLAGAGGLNDFELVVYSTVLDGNPRLAGIPTTVTSAYLRDDVVDSQRRRLPGRGR